MASVHFLCPRCETRRSADSSVSVPCGNCGDPTPVAAPEPSRPVERCAACGHGEMYVQKDFNRTTGLILVTIGAILVPWTYAISLVVVTIIDFVLYYKLGDVTVCYECRAVHRGYPLNPGHKPFDLATHDRHVYGAAPPGAEEANH
jgi:hypothetical protein